MNKYRKLYLNAVDEYKDKIQNLKNSMLSIPNDLTHAYPEVDTEVLLHLDNIIKQKLENH